MFTTTFSMICCNTVFASTSAQIHLHFVQKCSHLCWGQCFQCYITLYLNSSPMYSIQLHTKSPASIMGQTYSSLTVYSTLQCRVGRNEDYMTEG